MADYTPFDPHEYVLKSAVISTSRNSHTIAITTSLIELEIFEHIERAYLTGTLTFVDTGRAIEIMDFQGTEFFDVELALHTGGYTVKKKFVIREVVSIVPSTDTTDVVTLAIIDYDAYLSSLINVNKMYEGKPSEIIDDILRDTYGLNKTLIRSGSDPLLNEQNWDLASEIPEAASRAITKATGAELQASFRYIVPNLHPLEAIEVIKKRATGLTGAPFFCYASLNDNKYRFFDLYSLLQKPPINAAEPFIYSSQLAQNSKSSAIDIARSVSAMNTPKNANTLDLIMNGDVGALYEFVDTTHGLEFNLGYDLQKTLANLLQENAFPAADTRTKFNDKSVSDYRSKRIHKIATSNTYYDAKNIYEESSTAKHSSKAIQKSLRNLLGKSMLEITVPGLHTMPQNGHKTTGRVVSVISTADITQYRELFDRKRSGDYLVYATKHQFTQDRYSAGLSLVKIANYRGNTKVSS